MFLNPQTLGLFRGLRQYLLFDPAVFLSQPQASIKRTNLEGVANNTSVNYSESCLPPEGRVMTPPGPHEADAALLNPSLTAGTIVSPFLSRTLFISPVTNAEKCTRLLSTRASGTRRFPG